MKKLHVAIDGKGNARGYDPTTKRWSDVTVSSLSPGSLRKIEQAARTARTRRQLIWIDVAAKSTR
jgi:hypothetical protein